VAWQPFLVCCGYLLHFDILKNAKKWGIYLVCIYSVAEIVPC
jgi:hypothetical protein